MSDTEGEMTKRQVQISSAGKQADKLSKECGKTQKELDKATADLAAKQEEQQVRPRLPACASHHPVHLGTILFTDQDCFTAFDPSSLCVLDFSACCQCCQMASLCAWGSARMHSAY